MEEYRTPSDRVTQGIHNTAKKSRTNGNIDDLAGTFHRVTFLDETIVAEDGNTDAVRPSSERCEIKKGKYLLSGHVELEELGQAGATAEQETRGSIEVRIELTEGGNFTVLGKVELLRLGLDAMKMGGIGPVPTHPCVIAGGPCWGCRSSPRSSAILGWLPAAQKML